MERDTAGHMIETVAYTYEIMREHSVNVYRGKKKINKQPYMVSGAS